MASSNDRESSLPLLEMEGEKPDPSSRSLSSKVKAASIRLLRSLFSKGGAADTRQLKKTAYLDGLRGFCAFLVYLHHHAAWAHSGNRGRNMAILDNPFGWQGQYHFVCLPVIRIFWSGGNSAVAVFFLISGYVLSVSPLNAIHASDPGRLADSLTSAFFRRWLRLFLPVLAVMFIWATSWHVLGIRSNNPIAKRPEASYGMEIWRLYYNFKQHSFFFYETFWNEYNDHLWSIPLEFRGSFFVWTTLLAFARSHAHMRLCLEAGLVFYLTFIVDGWYCALFVIGLLLCECDVLAEKEELPRFLTRITLKRQWVYWLLLIIAMYLAGGPTFQHFEDPAKDIDELRRTAPGWYFLSFLVPQPFLDYRWWFRIVAGTLVMISIPRIPILKRSMESRFCQFLGKHSFALYLVHGPILWSIGDRVYAALGRHSERYLTDLPTWIDLLPLPSWGPLGMEVNYIVAQMLLLPFTLWVATLVTKMIDEPSVKFAKWMFDRCKDSTPRNIS